MQSWYQNLTKAQRALLYFVSIVLILVWGIGLIPLTFLLYLKFGSSEYKK